MTTGPTDGGTADGTNDGVTTDTQTQANPPATEPTPQSGTLQGEPGAIGQTAPGADVTTDSAPPATGAGSDPANPIQPSPTADTGQPGPLAPATSPDEVLADHPALGEQTTTATVPDNPSSDVPPNEVDTTVDTAHGWDAGVSTLDTGWFTPLAADEAFRAAQSDTHGVQDGYITVPAHLREVEDGVLALAKVVMAGFGPNDGFRVEVEVTENGDDVSVESRIARKAAAVTA